MKKEKLGDCFVSAFRKQQNNRHFILVHALITGQGAIEGIIYNHAWCEHDGFVYDDTLPDNFKKMKKEIYYSLARVQTTFKYNEKQTLLKILEFKTYGPWEEVLINNKF